MSDEMRVQSKEFDFIVNYDVKYRMGDALFESYEVGEGSK